MEEFLNSLTSEQLGALQNILKEEIDGDIDFFLFKIDMEFKLRDYTLKEIISQK